MSFEQHVLSCADAALITDEPVHEDCTVILAEASNEPEWLDGAVIWAMHARSESALEEPGAPADTRLNPVIPSQDWR